MITSGLHYHLICSTLLLSGAMLCARTEAGCPCRGKQAQAAPLSPIPMSTYAQPAYPQPAYPQSVYQPQAAATGTMPAVAGALQQTISPPPGTLGKTYQLRSKPIPVDMHPRMALLDVYVPNATSVFVHDMNPYRTQDRLDGFQDIEDSNMWHFETEPLYPGLPRIYRVEAEIVGDDGSSKTEERYVRLIMGRVLELRF